MTSRSVRIGLLAFAGASIALVACQPPKPPAPDPTVVIPYDCTDGVQTFEVPSGVTEIVILALGAQGGRGFADGTPAPGSGGLGGHALASVPVTPGETLDVHVGCRGTDATGSASGVGGFNGGGAGGNGSGGPPDGGGGGGASDVRRGADRLVIAGGGGGGGGSDGTDVGGAGGLGGGETGGDGGSLSLPTIMEGGTGGTQSAPGTGGFVLGEDGVGAVGGDGGDGISGGGGAGGGLFGGGGGGAGIRAGGGGGGSGFGPSDTTFESGVRSGHGRVLLAYTV